MVRGAVDQWSEARRRAVAIPAPGLRFPISSDRTKPRGAPRPDVALTLNNIAIFYEGRGESGSALAYSRKGTAAVLAHRTAESTGEKAGRAELTTKKREASALHPLLRG